MKKTIAIIIVCFCFNFVKGQELTTPQMEETSTINNLRVYFPFTLHGIPFSSIYKSYWYRYSSIYVVLYTEFYWKGEAKKHLFKKSFSTNTNVDGAWSMRNLTITPPVTPGKTIDEEKTTYYLIAYQQYGSKKSKESYATIMKFEHRPNEYGSTDRVISPSETIKKEESLIKSKFIRPQETKKKLD